MRLGRRGERIAARLLREVGYDVLARNFRAEAGEIDIVARDGETLCFVEVKTRRRIGKARPAAAVGK
ncbi:MAG: YraN family protein, partial [Lentisphaerae bacterium]|nr:YraN family protein [Lentisphaerota bacterium]